MSVFALTALTLASCHKDKVNYDDDQQTEMDNIGYLALGGLQASVMEDTENVNGSTRAEAPNINDFDVVIERAQYGEDGSVASYAAVAEYKYGELPVDPVALEGGDYRITISSQEMVGAEWERPVYSATKNFTIVRLETTTIDNIVCKLSNIKVTVSYSADIMDQLDTDYTKMTIAVGDNSLDYSMSETRGGYFQPEAAVSKLNLTLPFRRQDPAL